MENQTPSLSSSVSFSSTSSTLCASSCGAPSSCTSLQNCKTVRGHMRSASLENANLIISKNTVGIPIMNSGFSTGTLKSRNEQKRLRNKFGSYSNLDDYAGRSKAKFQSLRNMFEIGGVVNGPGISNGNSFHPCPDTEQYQDEHEKENVKKIDNRLQQEQDAIRNNINRQPQLCENQGKTLLKPIAFKPIPFEPDYSIPNRYNDFGDRYGSTPSLIPQQGTNIKFGSTSDLRYNNGYNSNYCSNYLTRRRCSRSLKINDSMESIRHTPDSDAISRNSTLKSNSKFLQSSEQFDMTPSPSDSGISELEAALKDRDSELSYLRQTMEHNEKVIFKVHKDKENYWEQETRRLKAFYESQQREHLLKIKKLEQMLTLQSFQYKQNKLRFSEDSSRLKEQFNDLKGENELLRNETERLKQTERAVRDRVTQLEEKIEVMDKLISNLKSQLEENEWTVCQKNGEIALMKTQLKEAKVELTLKEHEIVHLKTELQSRSSSHFEKIECPEIPNECNIKLETSQLNRIILLKDQVILALTNELSKLRKELSDLAIFHEYGEQPNGKYARLKYKIDHLTSICSKTNCKDNNLTKSNNSNSNNNNGSTNNSLNNEEDKCLHPFNTKNYGELDENNLEIIVHCLKNYSSSESICKGNLRESYQNLYSSIQHQQQQQQLKNNNESHIYDMLQETKHKNSFQDKNSFNNSNNLPTGNLLEKTPLINNNYPSDYIYNENYKKKDYSITNKDKNNYNNQQVLNHDSENVTYILRNELHETKKLFEEEKKQWADEKEKVLKYQRQLQMHYINMYQRMKQLEVKLVTKNENTF